MSTANFKLTENNGKSTTASLQIADNQADGPLATLGNAIAAVTLGSLKSATKSLDIAGVTTSSAQAPKGAQRGNKWVVRGTGADNEKYSFSIGTADAVDIGAQGSDDMDITTSGGDGETLKNGIEAVWKDDAGTVVTVDSIKFENVKLN